MFIKTTRSGGHSYVQLVESYRNEDGKPRQRTVATLGRLDEVGGGVDSLVNGLMRATGRAAVGQAAPNDALRITAHCFMTLNSGLPRQNWASFQTHL